MVCNAVRRLQNIKIGVFCVIIITTYQVVEDIQQVVDILAVDQTNVGLAQQAADLFLHLCLGHTHHEHEADKVVQHHRQQAILIMLQPFLLPISQ